MSIWKRILLCSYLFKQNYKKKEETTFKKKI